MILSSDRYYFVNSRRGQYVRMDIYCKAYVFFMHDTNRHEWFDKKGTVVKSDTKTNNLLRKHFNKIKKTGEI